jgi:hypothetical protein
MSSVRKSALSYLRQNLGVMPNGIICTSRYYPSEKSRTKRPSWWHEIPLVKLRDPKLLEVQIICEKETLGFYYLRVPSSFVLENLNDLCIRDNGKVSLFLSAHQSDIFTDYRGSAKIGFSQWLVAENK